MRIAVNTRLLLPGKLEGIGWVTYEVLKRITSNHPEHQFFFLFDRPYSSEFIFSDNVTPVVVHPPSRLPILWYLFFECGIPHALKKIHADLLISFDGWTSISAKIPKLTVFHDLNFEYFPDFIPKRDLRYVKRNVHRYAETSDRIVAVSEYTKKDIVKFYGISPNNIDVVYNAANPIYKPVNEEDKTVIKNKYANGCDFFVFVGSLHKRKNLSNLLLAFDDFKNQTNSRMKLVIVGKKMWRKGEFEDTFSSIKYTEDVLFTGYLDVEELSKVVASSYALMYVSFFEGFGIPIVEAFQAETAVITSNTTSMPEVAGDAALLVNPYDVGDISEAMINISSDIALRTSYINKGKIRREDFSWDKSAEEFWYSVEKVTNMNR